MATARTSSAPTSALWSSQTHCRPTSSSIRSSTTACWRRASPPRRARVSGKDVTPFLLDFLARETGGESLEANVRLVIRNAGLAARIAVELAA